MLNIDRQRPQLVLINNGVLSARPKVAERPTGFVPLLQLFERMALLGYSFDLTKWELLVNSELLRNVPPVPSTDCQVPHSLEERVHHILEVERQLATGATIDKVAFYLVISQLDDVPLPLVLEYIDNSIQKFFVVGDGMLRRLRQRPAQLGPDGEHEISDEIASAIVRDYPQAEPHCLVAYRQLLSTAFQFYFRASWRNKKPQPHRRWQRIITPDFLDYQHLPVKTIADSESTASGAPNPSLAPSVDKNRILGQLRMAAFANPRELFQAVRDAAMVIAAAAPRFPELAEQPDALAAKAKFATWVLSLIPPVMSAALFRVSQHTGAEKYANLIPDRKETGLESVLRTALAYWHT